MIVKIYLYFKFLAFCTVSILAKINYLLGTQRNIFELLITLFFFIFVNPHIIYQINVYYIIYF